MTKLKKKDLQNKGQNNLDQKWAENTIRCSFFEFIDLFQYFRSFKAFLEMKNQNNSLKMFTRKL